MAAAQIDHRPIEEWLAVDTAGKSQVSFVPATHETAATEITACEKLPLCRCHRHVCLIIKLDHLGVILPRLSELRLERGSTLASFRDLGSSLLGLRVLWVSACGVRHLDGVGALAGLEELYLAFNDVDDLTSIAMHERLEVRENGVDRMLNKVGQRY